MKTVSFFLFLVLVLVSAGAVLGPAFLTGPFRAQTEADIELGYLVSRWAPSVALGALLAGLGLTALLWRRSAGLKTKLTATLGCLILGAFSYLSRQTVAERNFSALPEVVRIPVADSTHVLPNDLVLGVTYKGEAAAYPVPIIGYHHIVNDRLGPEPFVVTY
jgi:hypothetical protein